MYEKLNTETNTIESVLNIHERYWTFFEKFPMNEYLIDFDFSSQDLKNDVTILLCTAKLIDRKDDKVLLKTTSSLNITIEHAWQYVESYAAARLFNRLGILDILDSKPADKESLKQLASQPNQNTSSPKTTPNVDENVGLNLPEIGELIPNEVNEPSNSESKEESTEDSAQTSTNCDTATTPDLEANTEKSVDDNVQVQAEAEQRSETEQSVDDNVQVKAENSTVVVESDLTPSTGDSPSSDAETKSVETDELAIEDVTGLSPQLEESIASLEEEMIEELEEGEISELSEERYAELELEAMEEMDSQLEESDLQNVSIALPTADMFGESPIDDTELQSEEPSEQVETSFDMLEELSAEEDATASINVESEPASKVKYDENNHPSDVPGTIWGNVVAAVKEQHGNDWLANLPTNMEEAIVVLQSR
ncbi:hypothetical protein VIBNIFTn2_120216 [Vibrio nigripulchritudo FTn2]|uniref:hypothetical protein n=1 Tax=Vibrio nigripulchritudo TaxID=28173 RepID=UPI0003B21DF1|nr:hypothetical protein [Vibrio nigripulchritudo]CCN40234.1 hypothetical protein VIBNIFTn2_120216 [Vibrio nigripulchritudo FTn2]